MPSSCNEIVKQLVWNSLMKGLVLKVKLIYVMSAWSQSCSVIFRECALRRTVEWSPQQQHPPLLVKVLGVLRAPEGNSWHMGALRGTAQAGRRRMVHSNDRALVIKPARPRPSTAPGLQVCHWEEAQRGNELFSLGFLKRKHDDIRAQLS